MSWFKKSAGSSSRVGVVVNADQVVVAHIENRIGTPHLVNCRSVAIDSEKSAPRVLTRLVKDLALEGELCNFVLSSQDYHLHLIEAPEVEESELRAAARWKVKDLLDTKPEEVAIDYFRVPQHAYRGRDMVYVVAVAKTRIRALVSMIEECGLVLDSIDVPELVLRNLAAHFVGDSDGAAFMDLRGSGSTMNITRAGDLYLSRRINSKLDSNIMQSPDWVAIKARLILEIQRSLDYYESQMGLPAINTLVLVQRRHDGSALADSLSQELTTRVRVLDLEEGLSSDVRLPPELQQVASIAIGATLRDFTPAIPTRGQRENSEVAA